MPNRQRHTPAHEQLRELAVAARREGVPFDDFWERAVRPGQKLVTTKTMCPPAEAIVWPDDSADRANAVAGIRTAREHWRRAYEGVPPTRGEVALSRLLAIVTEESGGSPQRDGVPSAA